MVDEVTDKRLKPLTLTTYLTETPPHSYSILQYSPISHPYILSYISSTLYVHTSQHEENESESKTAAGIHACDLLITRMSDILLLLLLLMSFIWHKFEGCSKCTMSTVTGIIAYVTRNVFSHARKTDSDMSSRSAAGRLFHTVGPLTAKLRSP